MSLFVTSTTSVGSSHGAFAIEATPPATIAATNANVALIVEQFPWGPNQVLTLPSSMADMLNMIAPPGMSRTGSGYLSVIQKAWSTLKFVRVTGPGALAAFADLPDAVPTNIALVTLKSVGAAGNAVTWTVANATDGVSTHFNLIVSVTSASGTTTDTVHNIDFNGSDNSVPAADLASALLIGSVAKLANGRPINGSGSFGSGADGTITSASYVGTQGTQDKGVALAEGDKSINFVFCGDPGNTLRAAVNAGLQAHADYMSDRVAVINGNSGQSLSSAQSDVANYRSEFCVYVDPWVYENDDTTGAKTLVPPAAFLASVATQLSPSTSVAWKADEVKKLLDGIVDLEFNRGSAASTNTDAGIVTVIREDTGGFAFEAGKVTVAPATPAKANLTRTRMGQYIARSIRNSLRSSVDAPNVPLNQQDIIDAVQTFMNRLKGNANTDPNHTPFVVDFSISSLSAFNTPASIAAGNFVVPLNAKIGSSMERIFLTFNFGETITITAS